MRPGSARSSEPNAMVVGMGRTIPRAARRYRRTFRPYSTKFQEQRPSSLPLTVGTDTQCYSGFRPPRRLRLAPNGSSSSSKCSHSTRKSTRDAQPFVAADRLRRPLSSNVRREEQENGSSYLLVYRELQAAARRLVS